MNQFDPNEHSHRRYNPMTGGWVQISPHRAKRPWQGQQEEVVVTRRPEYDPTCYLCPGNKRASGDINPDYEGTFTFVNDFAAIGTDVPSGTMGEDDELFTAKSEKGICKVICFSPRHDLTIAEMKIEDIQAVVELWIKEYKELGEKSFINHVQIFENKGQVMGCSNPHPHGQIWAQETIPCEPAKKQHNFTKYYQKHNSPMLIDYLEKELKKKERILFENEHFVGLVPFWAVWPYETMILPKRHIMNIGLFSAEEQKAFADAYRQITIMYDNIFKISFPYSAGIHQSPTDGKEHPEWQMHMIFYPPLLRSATVKKFMVGYEMLANPQRDITPEKSAEILRNLPKEHYSKKV